MSEQLSKEEKKSSLTVAQQLIDLQKQDAKLKKDELTLKEKEIDNAHEYALKALEANKSFYTNLPGERRKDRWQMIIGAGIAILISIGFFIYLFETGYGDLASDLIKILTGVIFGSGAGYGVGFHKGRTYQKKEEEN